MRLRARDVLVVLFAVIPTAVAAPPPEPLTSVLRESYQTMRAYIIASAELMPEDKYGFKVNPHARTFADWMKHTIEMNYSACSTPRGVAAPNLQTLEQANSKQRLTALLTEAFEFCDPAFRNITDAKLMTGVPRGGRVIYPVTSLIGLTNSLHEHYGNVIGYLRSNGITPPSTLRTQRMLE
jgi:hypothetical protein